MCFQLKVKEGHIFVHQSLYTAFHANKPLLRTSCSRAGWVGTLHGLLCMEKETKLKAAEEGLDWRDHRDLRDQRH